ncbi:hypothetical protein Enr10x_25420 [Gimesia panareensis]|uniref:Uncharacterized protein n=1 Tax=Gimesia panareensis TaxID=2527978 RepID=A0A517Q6G1_9PLAN|nr:hypothetical protein Enr10x_25420 [Gimesia panareensis]
MSGSNLTDSSYRRPAECLAVLQRGQILNVSLSASMKEKLLSRKASPELIQEIVLLRNWWPAGNDSTHFKANRLPVNYKTLGIRKLISKAGEILSEKRLTRDCLVSSVYQNLLTASILIVSQACSINIITYPHLKSIDYSVSGECFVQSVRGT